METSNNINIPNEIWATCILILVGCTVVGVGIGIKLSEIWAYTLIGVGTGFLVNAVLLLKVYYQKKVDLKE